MVLVRQGDHAAADPLYRGAIEVAEGALGPEHPHVGVLLAEHAQLLKKLGRKAESRIEERRAKAILESAAFPGQHTIDITGLR